MNENDWARTMAATAEKSTAHTRNVFGSHAMTSSEVLAFINESMSVIVSTSGPSGEPHMTGATCLLHEARLFFRVAERSALRRNLRAGSRVALGFVEPPWKRHVFIQGSVRFLDYTSEETPAIRVAFKAKFGWEPPLLAEVLPEKVFTWKT